MPAKPKMSQSLVIVESPAKCGKIEGFLGAGFKCIATFGHFKQLSDLKCVDVNNNFTPYFQEITTKASQIHKLEKAIKESDEVYLATDDDREGEAIAWHVCVHFNLPISTTKRIIFHEITKPAILAAVSTPTTVNMDIVHAQQGRQILDLIVGFKLSPLLWENISRKSKTGLSAGRCQTPALRIIYDNEKEIEQSPGKKVYNTTGVFTSKNIPFALQKHHDSEETMENFLTESVTFTHIYDHTKPKAVTKNPPTPFTTSTIQQTASNEMHISPKETMTILQKLYEGGYITYMRTDSTTYSEEFLKTAKPYITNKWGKDYLHPDVDKLALRGNENAKKSKKKKDKDKKDDNAQEAHEAIRPTKIEVTQVNDSMTPKEKKMYILIWRNTVESCMSPAKYSSVTAKISAPEETEYRYTAEQVVFAGWKIVKGVEETNQLYNFIQTLKAKSEIHYNKINSKVTLKDLKSHYTEAKLVQLLEQKGIGRPSTFSSLVDKIQERGYVSKENVKGKKIKCVDFELEGNELEEIENEKEFGNEKNKLVIQPLGVMVLEFLIKHFISFFEYEYTREMENRLDEIAKGEEVWHTLCRTCYDDIVKQMEPLSKGSKEQYVIDAQHTYIIGKHGPVIKCKNGDETTFKSVKKDISMERLKNGEYRLEDIVQDNTGSGRCLGKYQEKDVILKNGKYGLYVCYGGESKSLSYIKKKEHEITLEDVTQILDKPKQSGILRQLTKDISIREGKYGKYIYYQNDKMNRPQFLKLKGFTDNPIICKDKVLKDWIKKTYKVE
jgi:DNA topoisomerase-1